MTSGDLDQARLLRRANTVVVGSLELMPRRRGVGRRVPVEVGWTSGRLAASAVSSAAVTALAGERRG